MNTTTSTRLQRTCITAVAATVVAGVALIGSPASATTDIATGGGAAAHASSTFDIADYIAHRKAAWAQDRVDRFSIYR